MKSNTYSNKSASHLEVVREYKCQKTKTSVQQRKESREIMAYLSKLQELVPFMPKHKKLSKPEVISYVIEYIHDLEETLGLPSCNAERDVELKTTKSSECNQKMESTCISSSDLQ